MPPPRGPRRVRLPAAAAARGGSSTAVKSTPGAERGARASGGAWPIPVASRRPRSEPTLNVPPRGPCMPQTWCATIGLGGNRVTHGKEPPSADAAATGAPFLHRFADRPFPSRNSMLARTASALGLAVDSKNQARSMVSPSTGVPTGARRPHARLSPAWPTPFESTSVSPVIGTAYWVVLSTMRTFLMFGNLRRPATPGARQRERRLWHHGDPSPNVRGPVGPPSPAVDPQREGRAIRGTHPQREGAARAPGHRAPRRPAGRASARPSPCSRRCRRPASRRGRGRRSPASAIGR
jgi:hypothetical protein